MASLGVGTKFLRSEEDGCDDGDGEGERDGARMVDMHAEALCQAAFVRYLASAHRGTIKSFRYFGVRGWGGFFGNVAKICYININGL